MLMGNREKCLLMETRPNKSHGSEVVCLTKVSARFTAARRTHTKLGCNFFPLLFFLFLGLTLFKS